AVRDCRQVEQVLGPVDAIVEVERLALVPRRVVLLLLEEPQKLGRLGETGAGGSGGPAVGVVNRVVPARRAAHREAADDDAVAVDWIILRSVIEGLEGVDLAGEVVSVAVAAIGVQDDRVGRVELARALEPPLDEGEFAERLAATVEPEVEPML